MILIKIDKDMETMIITNDRLTATRIAVITRRTGSQIAGGAKAILIESAKRIMRNGICHFVYEKKDGSLREAWGTLNKGLVEKYTNGNGVSRECYATTAYFDTEKGGWRSFRWENLVAVL